MGNWSKLKADEKIRVIKFARLNGVSDINTIRDTYNLYSSGGNLTHKKSGEEQGESQDLNSSWLPQFSYTPSASQQQVLNTLGIEPMTALELYTAQEVSKEIDDPGYIQSKVNYNNSLNQQLMHIVEKNPGLTTMGETPLFNTAAGFMPVLGDAMQGAEAVAAAKQGDYLTAGLLGGMMLLPNIVEKPLKKIPFLKRLFGRTRTNPKNLESTINPIQGDDAVAMFRRWDPGVDAFTKEELGHFNTSNTGAVSKARKFYKLGDNISDDEIKRTLLHRKLLLLGKDFDWESKLLDNDALYQRMFDKNGNILMESGIMGPRFLDGVVDAGGAEASVFILGDKVYKVMNGSSKNFMGESIAKLLRKNVLGKDLMPPLNYEGYIQDINGRYRPIFSQEKLTPMPDARNGFFISDYVSLDDYHDKRINKAFKKRGIKPIAGEMDNTGNMYKTSDGIIFNDAKAANMGYDSNGILKIFDPYTVWTDMRFSPDFDAPIDFSKGFTFSKGGNLHSTGGPLYPFSFEKNPFLKTPVVRYDEGGQTYAVKKGDTFSLIAQNVGVSVLDLLKLNPTITNVNRIREGLNINIPPYMFSEIFNTPQFTGLSIPQVLTTQPLQQQNTPILSVAVPTQKGLKTAGPLDLQELAVRLAYTESRLRPEIVNGKGAYGLFQIMLPALDDYNRVNKTNYTLEDMKNADNNIKVRNWYMNYLSNLGFINKGDIQSDSVGMYKVLASFNAGAGNVKDALTRAKADGKDIYDSWDWVSYLWDEPREYADFILRGIETKGTNKNEFDYKAISTAKSGTANKIRSSVKL